jgi:hypothetical protein
MADALRPDNRVVLTYLPSAGDAAAAEGENAA